MSNSDDRSVIIIGAGIAGLAAGCYAQMNGYRSQVFELHDLPGGLCTAWERKDFIFDGCIHYLFGSGPGQPYYQLWEELGALKGRRMIDHDEFIRVTDANGKTLIAYCDPDRLAAHMKELSPADAHRIDDFAQGIRDFAHFDMTALTARPKTLMGPKDWAEFGIKMMPFVGPLAKWGLLDARDFAGRFQDPFLRRAIGQMFGWPEIPMMAALSVLAYMHTHNAGFPAGGSLEFARAIEKRYLELGGQIHYKAQVEKILVEPVTASSLANGRSGTGQGHTPENGHGVEQNHRRYRAVGVRLYNDEIHRADYVISAADGRGTLFDLLGGQFLNHKLRSQYSGNLPIHSQVQVSLGVRRDLSNEPHWVTYLLDEPLLIAGEEHSEIGVKNYCFDPSLAPEGKSVLIVMLRSDYDYWQRIYGRRPYDTEQLQVADIIIDFVEKLYPGIRQDIEVTDVATPLSYERYTGNWQGSSCGWLLTKKTMRLMISGLSKTLPGLENFYLAGQWVEPGGMVPQAAMSGRNAIQLLCHVDGRPFVTSPADPVPAFSPV